MTASQILAILKQAEADTPVPEICREHGISSATFYKWRCKYGGVDASLMARLKELEDENPRETAVKIKKCCRYPDKWCRYLDNSVNLAAKNSLFVLAIQTSQGIFRHFSCRYLDIFIYVYHVDGGSFNSSMATNHHGVDRNIFFVTRKMRGKTPLSCKLESWRSGNPGIRCLCCFWLRKLVCGADSINCFQLTAYAISCIISVCTRLRLKTSLKGFLTGRGNNVGFDLITCRHQHDRRPVQRFQHHICYHPGGNEDTSIN